MTAACALQLCAVPATATRLFGLLRPDSFSSFAAAIVVAITLAAALFASSGSFQAGERRKRSRSFHAILLLAAALNIFLVTSGNLAVMSVLAVASMAVSYRLLWGSVPGFARSPEARRSAAVFLLSSLLLLAGALTATLGAGRGALDRAMPVAGADTFAHSGLALMAAGFLLSLGAAPFHGRLREAIEADRTGAGVFAFTAGFAALLVSFSRALLFAGPAPGCSTAWCALLASMGVVSLAAGGLGVIQGKEVRRLLASSCVAHTGLFLLAIAFEGGSAGTQGIHAGHGAVAALFSLVPFAFAAAGAFGFLASTAARGRRIETLKDLSGLARQRPWAALGWSLCLMSLAGMPLTGGFMAKILVIRAGLAQGSAWPLWFLLPAAASFAALFYGHSRIVAYMYFMDPVAEHEIPRPAWPGNAALLLCCAVILATGIAPEFLIRLLRSEIHF